MSTASPSTRSKRSSSTADHLAAGRFAPSPTGPLHLGSLLAATASYLDARAVNGSWLLRIDDLDVHRNQPGAEQEILRALEAHGLYWDGAITRQSEQLERYEAALTTLDQAGLLFYCSCSRRQLKAFEVYPGTCRGRRQPRPDCALRVLVGDAEVTFEDLVQGSQQARLESTVGDFIVRRRDGLIAYQLATAVDDGAAAITRVVRGSDLLDNTPRQIFLMGKLGLAVPAYGHVPTLTHPDGAKLSKQTGARALDLARPSANLRRVLAILDIATPAEAEGWPPERLLELARTSFELERLPAADVALP